jgi:hypothetical protein
MQLAEGAVAIDIKTPMKICGHQLQMIANCALMH